MMLKRRCDSEARSWRLLEPELEPVDVETVPDFFNASNAIAAAETRNVKIKNLDSDLPFRRSIGALRAMTDEENPKRELLVCKNPLSLPFIDLYERIHEIEAYEETFSFNNEQTAGFHSLRQLPSGVCLIHVPPPRQITMGSLGT